MFSGSRSLNHYSHARFADGIQTTTHASLSLCEGQTLRVELSPSKLRSTHQVRLNATIAEMGATSNDRYLTADAILAGL